MARTPQQEKRLQELKAKKQQFNIAQTQSTQTSQGRGKTIGKPSSLSDSLPLLGAVAAPFAAPAGAGLATLASLSAAGGAIGELGRQGVKKEPFQPGRAAAQGALGAAGELTGGAARVALKPVVKVTGKFARKLLAPVMGFFTETGSKASTIALESPQVLKPGFASAKKVEDFVVRTAKGLDDVKMKISGMYKSIIAKEKIRTNGKNLIPIEPIKKTIATLKSELRLGTKEIRKVSPSTEKALKDLFARIDNKIGTTKHISLDDAVEIRKASDELIKFSESGLGEGLNPRAAAPLRQAVDEQIQFFHPEFKRADNAFQQGLSTIEDSRALLGIDDTLNTSNIPLKTLVKVESNLQNIFKRPEVFKTKLNALDEKLTTVDGFLADAEKFGAAKAFEKGSSGLARIGLIGSVVAGVSTIATGDGSPSQLAKVLPLLALTSPAIVGKGIRASAAVGPEIGAGLLRTAGQAGVRGVSNAAGNLIDALREPQETNPRRLEEANTLSKQLNLQGPSQLKAVPRTDLFRSKSGETIVSTPKATIPVDEPLEKALFRQRIVPGRSKAIE